MSRRKEAAITPEERERNRRAAEARMHERCEEAAKAATLAAQAWLVAEGALVPGEGVGDRLRRLAAYRQRVVEASAPSYRPTARQQMLAEVPGIMVEVEF